MAAPAPQSSQIAALDIVVTELPGAPTKGTPAPVASNATARVAFDFSRDALLDRSSFPSIESTHIRSAQPADFLSFEGSFIKGLVRINWNVRANASALGFAVERRSQLDGQWSTVQYFRATENENRNGYTFYDRDEIDGVTYYRIRQVGADGASIPTPALSVMPHLVPDSFIIWQHNVDSFTRFGTLSFGVGSEMTVSISMTDSYGRTVASLLDEHLPSGHHIIPFNTQSLPTGIYNLRMESGNSAQSRRLAIF
ncbi:MAG: hypothetical protein KFF77_02970 [Bacteroidetes bacterium]|nr:hypothetical protein [Bacteroidota bacterium]